jgi:hypothetical protein
MNIAKYQSICFDRYLQRSLFRWTEDFRRLLTENSQVLERILQFSRFLTCACVVSLPVQSG